MRVAYRAIRSRQKFSKAPDVQELMKDWLEREAKPHFIKRFEHVVANWEHKPDFKARKYFWPDYIAITVHPVGPNKQIYTWVTEGTKGPYKIPKAGPGYLAFQLGYKPKTKPKGKIGGPGTYSGPWVRGVMQVTHPGIEAREFEKVIADDEKKWFSRNAENAWRRTLRAI